MPNLESGKKALRQNVKRAARNKMYKNRIKKLTHEMSAFINGGKRKEATNLISTFYKAIDKAAKNNIMHKNTASRKKAVMTKQIGRLK